MNRANGNTTYSSVLVLFMLLHVVDPQSTVLTRTCIFQIDFHALGNCIHQLLHLQPLTTMRENVTHLGTRGLDLQSVRRQLHSHTGGAAKDGAAKEGVQRYAVPQMSLKRYCVHCSAFSVN